MHTFYVHICVSQSQFSIMMDISIKCELHKLWSLPCAQTALCDYMHIIVGHQLFKLGPFNKNYEQNTSNVLAIAFNQSSTCRV